MLSFLVQCQVCKVSLAVLPLLVVLLYPQLLPPLLSFLLLPLPVPVSLSPPLVLFLLLVHACVMDVRSALKAAREAINNKHYKEGEHTHHHHTQLTHTTHSSEALQGGPEGRQDKLQRMDLRRCSISKLGPIGKCRASLQVRIVSESDCI